MNKFSLAILSCCLLICGCTKNEHPDIVTSDITNFWAAYDKIITVKDSAQQYEYLNSLFISKGTPGLQALMKAREYTAQSYIEAINKYPAFWNSIRQNTLRAEEFASEIEKEIGKLKELYPDMKPAKIYFSMGALRTNGTTLDGMVLIGSEVALTDQNTVVTDFPEDEAVTRKKYFSGNPINNVVLLNVHEYVHTQQKEMIYNLLSESIYEGVAEFVSVKSTGKTSAVPAIEYGKKNEEAVRNQFEKEMFDPSASRKWLWSDAKNQFGQRDLGYFIGYAICERYYNLAADKKNAIKKMIELNYTNEKEIEQFVDTTGFFSAPLNQLYEAYESKRPSVISLGNLENGSTSVDPATTQITIQFSAEMDTNYRGFDYGPLGEKAVLSVKKFLGFSADGKSATIEVELKPDQQYQVLLTNQFRTKEGIILKPYLIDLKTAAK